MEEVIINFLSTQGWKLILIALSGIPLLGILKRFHIFDNFKKEKRGAAFLAISAIFSIVATLIYLSITNYFTYNNLWLLASGMFVVNQTGYVIYKHWLVRIIRLFYVLFKRSTRKGKVEQNIDNVDIIDDLPSDDKK